MGAVWKEEAKLNKWLQIEVLACEALTKLGEIPPHAMAVIKERARFDIGRMNEIEKRVRHDVVAFLTSIGENIGPESRYLHLGLTSSDVLDTALASQMREAAEIIIEDMNRLLMVIKRLSKKFKYSPMIGRTHGVHAEPTTFGLKMALWYTEMQRNRERMERAKEDISYGKLSGAVGTFAHVLPFVEEYVCEQLGLKPEPVSSQIIQRDRHAQYLLTLAIIASSLDKFATEIRHLQKTETREVEEPFAIGQKGSSAMPHKRNPVSCEQISGLSRIIRANSQAALENVPLWHERDISHSSVERVIIPDSTILLDYMLQRFIDILEGLQVYPENMKRNLEYTKGLAFSEKVLLELVRKGVSREEAYAVVQSRAMKAWEKGDDFKALLLQDREVLGYLSPEEIESCFRLDYFLRHVDTIFKRVGIED